MVKEKEDKKLSTLVSINPKRVGFNYQDRLVQFERNGGEVIIAGNTLRLKGVRGYWGNEEDESILVLDGEANLVGDAGFTFKLDTKISELDTTAKAMMPNGLRKIVDAITLDGPIEVAGGVLSSGKNDDEETFFDFTGKVIFDGTAMNVGVPLTKLKGDLKINKLHIVGDQLKVEMNFEAKEVLASKRKITFLELGLKTNEAGDRLLIEDVRGDMYKGRVTGNGSVGLEISRILM